MVTTYGWEVVFTVVIPSINGLKKTSLADFVSGIDPSRMVWGKKHPFKCGSFLDIYTPVN